MTRSGSYPAPWRIVAAGAAALLLGGCGAAASSPQAALRAQPAAQLAADPKIPVCDQADGQPANASINPGSITTDPATWGSNSTMAAIRKAGKMKVGVAGDVLLWGARDPQSGDFKGYDIDVLNAIAKAIGPKVELDFTVVNFAGRLPALDSKKVQLVADTMTMTCDRWFGGQSTDDKFINFSTEYYRAGQKVLVRADDDAEGIADLADQKVCAAKGSTSLQNLEGRVKTPVVVDDIGECLVKFQEGEATAITGDDTVLAGFAKQDPYAKVVGDPFTTVPYGVGVAPDDVTFTQFVNYVLEQMRQDGRLAALNAKYMKGTGSSPTVPAAVYGRDLKARS